MYINNKSKLQDSHTKGNTITEIHINVLPTLVLDFSMYKNINLFECLPLKLRCLAVTTLPMI